MQTLVLLSENLKALSLPAISHEVAHRIGDVKVQHVRDEAGANWTRVWGLFGEAMFPGTLTPGAAARRYIGGQ